MAFVAADPKQHLGTVVDNGHCMRHVQIVAGVTHSSTLRRGQHVRGSGCAPGTVIGTFDADDRYANATDGSSHVAIFLAETEEGLRVIDQWVGQPVHERLIRFRDGEGSAVNDGSRFYVVESATA
jgi:hypothetical protein